MKYRRFRYFVLLLGEFCQFPTSSDRTRQRVELPKLKSIQPRLVGRLFILRTCPTVIWK